jgi:uncharacterized membrane protein YdbT with pleckstrin-like domain
MASGGRIRRARYRLTTKMLYFEHGVLSTTAEQIPLWAIRDLDLKQSVTQKLRTIGTLVVHVEHSDYTGRSEVMLEDIEQPAYVRDLINQGAHRERIAHERHKQTRFYNR